MAATTGIYYLCKLECVVGESQYVIIEKQDVNNDQPIRFGSAELYDIEYHDTTMVGAVIAMGRNVEKLQSQIQRLIQGDKLSQNVFNTQSSQSQAKSQTSYSQVATTSKSKSNVTQSKDKSLTKLVQSKTKRESDSVLSQWSNSQNDETQNSQTHDNDEIENAPNSPSTPQSPSLLDHRSYDSPLRRPQRKGTRRVELALLDHENDGGDSETDWEPSPQSTSIFTKKSIVKPKKSSTWKEISNRPLASLESKRKGKTVQNVSFSQGSGTGGDSHLKRKIALLEAENSKLKTKKRNTVAPIADKIKAPTSHVLVEDDDEEDINNDIKVLGTYEDGNEEKQIVQVDRFQYGLINFREPISAIKKLSVMVFTPEVLATHTYTGKKSNAHLKDYTSGSKPVKQQLCPHLLGIVVDHTFRRFTRLTKDGMFRDKKNGAERQLLATDLISAIQVKCACLSATGRY